MYITHLHPFLFPSYLHHLPPSVSRSPFLITYYYFGSDLGHIMLTFTVGMWYVYMRHLKSFHLTFLSSPPLTLSLRDPFSFAKDYPYFPSVKPLFYSL